MVPEEYYRGSPTRCIKRSADRKAEVTQSTIQHVGAAACVREQTHPRVRMCFPSRRRSELTRWASAWKRGLDRTRGWGWRLGILDGEGRRRRRETSRDDNRRTSPHGASEGYWITVGKVEGTYHSNFRTYGGDGEDVSEMKVDSFSLAHTAYAHSASLDADSLDTCFRRLVQLEAVCRTRRPFGAETKT